jgi:hypothetical protein
MESEHHEKKQAAIHLGSSKRQVAKLVDASAFA